MPIYEYQCTACHHHFDLIQKISDTPIKQCPKCFEGALIKLISPAGFQLKGNGWYATDFKNSGKSASPKDSLSTSTTTKIDKKECDPPKAPKSKNDE